MSDYIQQQKDELDDYVSKWEKAQADGLFDKDKMPPVNPETATGSFFGFVQTNPTDNPSLSDNEYWKAISSAADDHDNITTINESKNLEHKDFPSNPLNSDSVGCDQKMSPQSLGQTYTEEELIKLSDLKKDLYELESKILKKKGFGDNKDLDKMESKISLLKRQIHELSDEMGIAYKNDYSSKAYDNF
jgi:hypothetical protein